MWRQVLEQHLTAFFVEDNDLDPGYNIIVSQVAFEFIGMRP